MIIFRDHEHARIIARVAGNGFDPEVDFVVSSVNKAGKLLGGVIYTNFTGRTVQMHMAGLAPRWASPHLMWCAYDFPFNCLKVEQVIGTVPSTNTLALKLDYKMGFSHLVTVPGIVRGGDMEVLSMSREACRYLKLGWRYNALENAA